MLVEFKNLPTGCKFTIPNSEGNWIKLERNVKCTLSNSEFNCVNTEGILRGIGTACLVRVELK